MTNTLEARDDVLALPFPMFSVRGRDGVSVLAQEWPDCA